MSDNYHTLRYEGLLAVQWTDLMDRYSSFEGAGASITSAVGNRNDGWLQINAGGPNSHGYCAALKNIIRAQTGIEPVEDQEQTMEEAKVRTAEDVNNPPGFFSKMFGWIGDLFS